MKTPFLALTIVLTLAGRELGNFEENPNIVYIGRRRPAQVPVARFDIISQSDKMQNKAHSELVLFKQDNERSDIGLFIQHLIFQLSLEN